MESLESRLALSTLMEVKVEATDLAGNPITAVEAGDEFLLRATVQDLRANPTGVFAAYVDVTYDASKVAVDGAITHSTLYRNGRDGDTSVAGLIDDAGGIFAIQDCTSFPCTGDGDEELLFSIPLVAIASGTVIFDVGPANDPTPVHNILIFGSNLPVASEDIDFIDETLLVTQPTATDLLSQLISNLESISVENGLRNALEAKLNGALRAFPAENGDHRQDGVNKLNAFIHLVEAQRGKAISDADADFLIDSATTIINLASSNIT
jgi:hypothetical protein